MSKSPCSAIHHGFCVTAYGGLNPCCATVGDFSKLKTDDDASDYWNNNGYLNYAREAEYTDEWIPECTNCLRKNERGIISRKDKFDQWYSDINEEFTKKNPKSIVHFDISFGTTCSQQCIMCNSRFSSKWLADDIALKEEGNDVRMWKQFDLANWSITHEQLDQIASLVDEHTRKIEIKGGEPLYDKRFEYFVNKVLEKNPDVEFSTNTNGMHFNDKTIEMLNNIKRLNIDVSIDGTGKLYEWVRSSDWDELEKNWNNVLGKLKHTPNLNYTTMCYNVDHIEKMYQWAANTAHKFGREHLTCNFTQIVTTPKYMAPEYASKERLHNALEQIDRVIQDPEKICTKSKIFRPRLELLKNYIKKHADTDYNKEHYDNFKRTHETMTKIRKWDIHDFINM